MKKTQIKLVASIISLIAISIFSSSTFVYAEPPSININIPGDNPTPPCTEGALSSNNTLLCQNGVNVLCNSGKEGTKSIDGTLQCKSNKWQAVSVNNDDKNPSTPTSLISKVSVVPASFNPSIDSTKISYTTSLKSIIDVKITDSLGQPVGTLTDSQTLAAGSYFVIWYGTISNIQGGTVLHSGTYHYKITAKNIKTNKIEDTKEGNINLIFAAQQSPVIDPETTNPGPTAEELAAQAKATLALQNAKKGKTAKVGPGILIYSIFPIIGYIASRRRK